MSLFLCSLGRKKLLVMLLLLLLCYLDLVGTGLCFEFLDLAQPALFGCLEIWERLRLSGWAGGLGWSQGGGTIDNVLSGVTLRGRTLNQTIDIR